MLPLLYLGFISFSSGFVVSYSTTREILRFSIEDKMIIEKKKIVDKKVDSKVKFKQNVQVRLIPTVKNISSNTINKLWYNKEDYKNFKIQYSLERKYSSI